MKFVVDCHQPVDDNILDVSHFEKSRAGALARASAHSTTPAVTRPYRSNSDPAGARDRLLPCTHASPKHAGIVPPEQLHQLHQGRTLQIAFTSDRGERPDPTSCARPRGRASQVLPGPHQGGREDREPRRRREDRAGEEQGPARRAVQSSRSQVCVSFHATQ